MKDELVQRLSDAIQIYGIAQAHTALNQCEPDAMKNASEEVLKLLQILEFRLQSQDAEIERLKTDMYLF